MARVPFENVFYDPSYEKEDRALFRRAVPFHENRPTVAIQFSAIFFHAFGIPTADDSFLIFDAMQTRLCTNSNEQEQGRGEGGKMEGAISVR